MDMSAVSGKTVRRDIEIYAGDEFTLNLTVYPSDSDQQSAEDMTGDTLTLKVFYAGPAPILDYEVSGTSKTPVFSITGTAGTTSTFAFTSSMTENLKGRYTLRIEHTESGLTRTLVNGALTVH